MSADPPPSPVPAPGQPAQGAIEERLVPLLEAAHRVWSSPQERRRMRAFGFIPAREPGVLKREWHGHQVRVGHDEVRFGRRGEGELAWRAGAGLRVNGDAYRPTPAGLALAEGMVTLIQAYERWVEAREGREERLRRGHWSTQDRRSLNALAETRRLQRLFNASSRRPARPR
ncbi:MAG: hypothetical protein MUE51_07950 [Thermoleophilia bacterium]|nr:hypothetical protein [Thermoleophilia bacterium]